jgi:hypothetical protein
MFFAVEKNTSQFITKENKEKDTRNNLFCIPISFINWKIENGNQLKEKIKIEPNFIINKLITKRLLKDY